MKTVKCPHCNVKLSPSPVEDNSQLCMNTDCNAVFVTDSKGNVITDSMVV